MIHINIFLHYTSTYPKISNLSWIPNFLDPFFSFCTALSLDTSFSCCILCLWSMFPKLPYLWPMFSKLPNLWPMFSKLPNLWSMFSKLPNLVRANFFLQNSDCQKLVQFTYSSPSSSKVGQQKKEGDVHTKTKKEGDLHTKKLIWICFECNSTSQGRLRKRRLSIAGETAAFETISNLHYLHFALYLIIRGIATIFHQLSSFLLALLPFHQAPTSMPKKDARTT